MTVTKMNKKQFIRRMAEDRQMSVQDAMTAYDAVIETIQDVVRDGTVLSLMKFGNFSIQKHRGHPVKFDDTSPVVRDYVVFKFSASDALNKEFRQQYADGKLTIGGE